MQKKMLASLLLVFVFSLSFTTPVVLAATDDHIVFLHHSTGAGVWSGGDVSGWFSDYNDTYGTSYDVAERSYPNTPYPWDNYPYDYWNLWINGACNSSDSDIECMNTLAASHDIIIFKHCFPGADVVADNGSPNVGSSVQTLANYQLQYRALRQMMDGYPNTKFIIWTLAPLRQVDTNPDNAARAKQFVDWVKGAFLTEGGQSHPNIFIFDFWGNVAGSDNYLRDDYENGSDSHPNATANATVGPIFSQFIVDTADASLGTVTAPAAPGGLTVD